MYWEDRRRSPRAPYLDLCIESIRHNAGSCQVRLLHADSVLEWLPDVAPERWRRLQSPVHRSDYARTRLLERYGGLWLDVDTIALRPLSELTQLLAHHEVVGWGHELGQLYSNCFAARPGADLITAWGRAQDEIVDARGATGLRYAELGQVVNQLVSAGDHFDLPIGRVAPVPWHSWRQFFSCVQSPRRVLAADPYVVVLWNKAMGRRLQHASAAEVLDGKMLLSRLLRIALDLSTVEEESRGLARLDVLGRLRFSLPGRSMERRVRRTTAPVRRLARRGTPAAAHHVAAGPPRSGRPR